MDAEDFLLRFVPDTVGGVPQAPLHYARGRA